jgi:hypothetical protein|tara:strand:- start:262 stop:924 length:663 start_codon:yes stop_codon:yes gene_type:complete
MSQDDNFFYLIFSLILLLLGTAMAQQFFSYSVQHLMQSTTVITLMVAVWGVDSKQVILRKAFFFPLAIVTVALISYWLDTTGFDYIHLFLLLIFFISTAQKTAKQVLFTGEIDGNKILGAICLYLLMGLIWAILYTLMQLSFVGSFQHLDDSTEWFTLFPDFIYFSFVTLTTLGFGDISPVQPVARFLVYLEAIIGQLYLAILVASLVGSRMSAAIKKNK